MAVLDRKNHPLMQKHQQYGQALALLGRRIKQRRSWSDEETALAASNPLLKSIPADPAELLKQLEADNEKLQKEIADEAKKVSDKQLVDARVALLAKAEQTHGNVAIEKLNGLKQDLEAVIAANTDELKVVKAELARRRANARVLDMLATMTDTQKAILAQILAPASIDERAKVGTPKAK